ncbi:hypothetical protein AB1Y20_015812 [Prymnesium parvum]|uniref:Amine oxidase domain-containing protein n=1 Tax=Prymnesium parvum TaxID=97485 RepID=A0AB34JYY8_PRYPA
MAHPAPSECPPPPIDPSDDLSPPLPPPEPSMTRRRQRDLAQAASRPRRGARDKSAPPRFDEEPSTSAAAGRAKAERPTRPRGAPPAKRPRGKLPRVVVVGAGFAGVSAGRLLHDFGYDVLVLEARERLGGRVHSVPVDGVTVELGAAVLMGVQGGNPLVAQCRKHGVRMRKLDNSCPLHDIDGTLLPPDTDQRAEALFNQLLDNAAKERGATSIPGDPPVGTRLLLQCADDPARQWSVRVVEKAGRKLKLHYDGWNSRFDTWMRFPSPRLSPLPADSLTLDQVLDQQLQKIGTALDQQSRRALNWHLANLEFACAASLRTVSAEHWDQDDVNEYDGDHVVMPEGGYGELLQRMAGSLRVRYHVDVRQVQYDFPSGGARVIAEVGGKERSFNADVVLMTVPLGVLQRPSHNGGIEFVPPLPDERMAAIHRLGFGLLNKVVLFFPAGNIFWQHRTDFFGRTVKHPSDRGLFFLFCNWFRESGHACLIALAAGKSAAGLEELSDDDCVAEAMLALESMFGVGQVPSPERVIVTRWGSDPYARGSYSFVQVGASGSDYAALAKPLGKALHFAGEHTNEAHPATVVGAHLSGLRAAREIHRDLKHRL